jgi:hypothetical protein
MLEVGDQVSLGILFTDPQGNPINTDAYPQISIVQPNGTVMMNYTSIGVTQVDVGKYQYTFTVPLNGPYGIFNDNWQGSINGFRLRSSMSFAVTGTNIPQVPSQDGFHHLGDYMPTNFSQTAIVNINGLLRLLKARLNSDGKSLKKDASGNEIVQTCNIFKDEDLVSFLIDSLSLFNQTAYFTAFTFEDVGFVNQFASILTEGAFLLALYSRVAIEKGSEFNITDQSAGFSPPGVGDTLKSMHDTIFGSYNDRVKRIKESMRPAMLGTGLFSMLSGGRTNPTIQALRNLRARRMF